MRPTILMSAALARGDDPYVGMVEVTLPEYVIRLIVGSGEFLWGGNRFAGRDDTFGVIESVTVLRDGAGDEAPEWTITFVPASEVSAGVLSSAGMQGSRVRAWLAVVDRATGLVIPDPLLLFEGELDVPRLLIGRGTRTLEYQCVSALDRFHDNDEGVRLSDAHHRSVFPNETGLANMTGIERTSYWGVEKPPSGVTYGGGVSGGILGRIQANVQ